LVTETIALLSLDASGKIGVELDILVMMLDKAAFGMFLNIFEAITKKINKYIHN